MSESDHSDALKYLERLADGDAPELDPATVKALGFSAEILARLSLRAPGVRAHAFRAVGEIGGPEAIKFLNAKSRADFDPAVPELWRAVQVSVQAALLGQLTDRSARSKGRHAVGARRNPGGHSCSRSFSLESVDPAEGHSALGNFAGGLT